MRASILKSLTPFVTSELDSRGLIALCKVCNFIYCTGAILSILTLGIINPWDFGHLPTALATILVYVFIGIGFQLLRNASIEKKVTEYNIIFLQIQNSLNINIESNAMNNPEEQDSNSSSECLIQAASHKKGKPGLKTLEEGESPFLDSALGIAFDKVMRELPDGKIGTGEGRGLVKALGRRYDGVEIVKPTAWETARLKWLLKTYFSKFSKVKYSSIYTAQNYEGWEDEWTKKIENIIKTLNN